MGGNCYYFWHLANLGVKKVYLNLFCFGSPKDQLGRLISGQKDTIKTNLTEAGCEDTN